MEDKEASRAIKRIEKKLDKMFRRMDEAEFCNFTDFVCDKKRVLKSNIFYRLMLTLGIITGSAIVIAIVIFFANRVIGLRISFLADYINDLIDLVNLHHPQ